MSSVVPSALQYLEGEKQRKIAAIRELADKAQKEGRGPTWQERGAVERQFEEIGQIDRQLEQFRDAQALKDSIDRLGRVNGMAPADVTGRSSSWRGPQLGPGVGLGDLVVQSDGFKALVAGPRPQRWTSPVIEVPYPDPRFARKAAITDDDGNPVLAEGTTTTVDGGPADLLIQPQVLPGIQAPGSQRLTIADLFAPGTATSNVVRVLRESSTTNNATGVHEGAPKPGSIMEFDVADTRLSKIATFLEVSDEVLDDGGQTLRDYLNTRLADFVRIEEEDQLLNGTGGEDIDGVLDQVTQSVDATGFDNLFDAIAAAMVLVRTGGFLEPDAIVINPHDSIDLDTAKASTAGTYLSGGPFSASNNPWGVRMVRTTAIAAGTVLVGAFRTAAQLFRKPPGLRVEFTNAHEDLFRRNVLAIRAEIREALVIYRLAGFAVITNAS
jgi:HK97 family phage major capsid protein